MVTRCFACDRKLGKNPATVTTGETFTDSDGVTRQYVLVVGSECFKKIQAAGYPGWQPPTGGPRLYLLDGILRDESQGKP